MDYGTPAMCAERVNSGSVEGQPADKQRVAKWPRTATGWVIAVLFLSIAGMLLSAELIRLHVAVHTGAGFRSYCALGGKMNCETVALSEYAMFAGLPVAAWGLLGYALMAVAATVALRRRRNDAFPLGLMTVGGWLYAAVGLVLAGVSHLVIGSLCLLCAGTYGVSFATGVCATCGLRTATRSGVAAALRRDVRTFFCDRRLVAAVGALVLAFALVWRAVPPYWEQKPEPAAGKIALATGMTAEGKHWLGASTPRATISEFSDYECPHCGKAHTELRALLQQHPHTLRLVHRSFPLDQACNPALNRPFHPNACRYAALAHCAGEQSAFWPVNDYLYANGRRQEPVTAAEIAQALGLDAASLQACSNAEATAAAIARDLDDGQALGIRGTPTFVLDDRTFPGRIPADVLDHVLGGDPPRMDGSE